MAKFPGWAILDLRIGHREKHPIHTSPISVLLGWPPYVSISWIWPFTGGTRQFWLYFGWEPEYDHFDKTFAFRPFTGSHLDYGRDEDCSGVPYDKS